MFNSRDPIYRQIADRIRSDVLNGSLPAEAPVMSTNQYAAFYGINPATAAKAFQQLVDEGVIYKRRGVGMFVRPGAREQLQAQRRHTFFEDEVEALVAQARAIGIPLSDIISRLQTLDQEDEQ